MTLYQESRTRAQESRAALQRLYIAMRHLFIRGGYKPLGVSGEAMIEALTTLRPEIYGSITDPEKIELEGLLYIFQRLPKGIEECRFIRLVSREGLEHSSFQPIIPPKRRRNAYRVDEEQMFIEMTRGRSDIYDILTHLTFMYVEAEKIRRNSLDHKDQKKRDWKMLEEFVQKEERGEDINLEVAATYLSTLLGRTYEETIRISRQFSRTPEVNSIFHITYWLGKLSMEEYEQEKDREITFSSALRDKVGHHVYGEIWANDIRNFLLERNWLHRPIHIISANLHSVMNCLYAFCALEGQVQSDTLDQLATELSISENRHLREKVNRYASEFGMSQLNDTSGTGLSVQIFDLSKLDYSKLPTEISWNADYLEAEQPLLLVMDYAFGEQAYETIDELLKPHITGDMEIPLNVQSISIMGKAGILEGKKGDIMVPTAHVFEGTADNYPIDNEFTKADFEGFGLDVFEGPMITVLGTSLQNRDILHYFLSSSWRAIGLEMEGAHYQKAIQAASKIRRSINEAVVVRYAYYASDNPLVTGHTLASGSLGVEGVKPTYVVTMQILNKILNPKNVKKRKKEGA